MDNTVGEMKGTNGTVPLGQAGTAEAYSQPHRNKRERHWGLVPSLPAVGWSDSNLTRKMADGWNVIGKRDRFVTDGDKNNVHISGDAHRNKDGSSKFARSLP